LSFSISTTNRQQFSKLQLKQVSILHVQYNIPSGNNTLNYKLLQTTITASISINPGIYSESTLVTALNAAFTTAKANITVSFNSELNILTFTRAQQMEFYFSSFYSDSINPLVLGFLLQSYTSNSDNILSQVQTLSI